MTMLAVYGARKPAWKRHTSTDIPGRNIWRVAVSRGFVALGGEGEDCEEVT